MPRRKPGIGEKEGMMHLLDADNGGDKVHKSGETVKKTFFSFFTNDNMLK